MREEEDMAGSDRRLAVTSVQQQEVMAWSWSWILGRRTDGIMEDYEADVLAGMGDRATQADMETGAFPPAQRRKAMPDEPAVRALNAVRKKKPLKCLSHISLFVE
jgi:hypothetical protein